MILLIRFIISGTILLYLFSNIKFSDVQSLLNEFKTTYFLSAAILVNFQIIIASKRWQKILFRLGAKIGFKSLVRIHWSGLFLNIVLPGTIGGDAYRILKVRDYGVSYSKGLASVVLDQFLLLVVSTFTSFIFFNITNVYTSSLLLAIVHPCRLIIFFVHCTGKF